MWLHDHSLTLESKAEAPIWHTMLDLSLNYPSYIGSIWKWKCTFNHCELWCMISSGPMIWAQCFAPLPPPPPKKKKVKKKNQNQQTSSMSFSSKAESDKVWWMVRLVELVSLSSFKNIAFFYISFFILDSVLQFRVEGHLYGWVKWFIYFVFLESNLEVLITYAKFALDLLF